MPDGNHSIARHLLKALLPAAVSGENSIEGEFNSEVDYASFDRPGNDVRLRLRAMAVKIEHGGSTNDSQFVVHYTQPDGRVYRATGRGAIMAGWGMVAKHIIPELHQEQMQLGRLDLENKPFEEFEREIRIELNHMFGPGDSMQRRISSRSRSIVGDTAIISSNSQDRFPISKTRLIGRAAKNWAGFPSRVRTREEARGPNWRCSRACARPKSSSLNKNNFGLSILVF